MIINIQSILAFLLVILITTGCSKKEGNIIPTPIGKIKKYTYLSNSNGSGNYYYNKHSNLNEFKWISHSGFIDVHENYIYSKDKIIEIIAYKAHKEGEIPEILGKEQFFYRANGTLEAIHIKEMPTDKLLVKLLFTVNDKSQTTKCTYINLYPIPNYISDTIHYEFEYDNNGNLITRITKRRPFPYEDFRVESKAEYSYDNQKNPYQGLPFFYFQQMHQYISPNNIVREIGYGIDGTSIYENNYEYEYNAGGKPVRVTEKMEDIKYGEVRELHYQRVASIDYY